MSELVFEVFILFIFLVVGLLIFVFRNRRNYFIGFRIGYIYMFDRVWREIDIFVGFFMMVFLVLFFGFVLVGLGIFIFIFIMFVGVVFFMVVGFRVVKKVYEEEELLIEVLEKLFEKIEVNVRLYLVIQFFGLVVYIIFVVIFWDKFFERVVIYFNVFGELDNFVLKILGILLFLFVVYLFFFVMIYFFREFVFVLFFRFSRRGWKVFVEFMIVMVFGLVVIDSLVFFYNVG